MNPGKRALAVLGLASCGGPFGGGNDDINGVDLLIDWNAISAAGVLDQQERVFVATPGLDNIVQFSRSETGNWERELLDLPIQGIGCTFGATATWGELGLFATGLGCPPVISCRSGGDCIHNPDAFEDVAVFFIHPVPLGPQPAFLLYAPLKVGLFRPRASVGEELVWLESTVFETGRPPIGLALPIGVLVGENTLLVQTSTAGIRGTAFLSFDISSLAYETTRPQQLLNEEIARPYDGFSHLSTAPACPNDLFGVGWWRPDYTDISGGILHLDTQGRDAVEIFSFDIPADATAIHDNRLFVFSDQESRVSLFEISNCTDLKLIDSRAYSYPLKLVSLGEGLLPVSKKPFVSIACVDGSPTCFISDGFVVSRFQFDGGTIRISQSEAP
ncbi:MAG: hypothetical protein V3V08_02570 [Nannocystaceae bacterium]